MPRRVEERIRPITPQLAWRVAVLGGAAFVLFGIVFFRLWFLQVLSGSEYANQAKANILRAVPVAAPRGEILDRSGNVLVDSAPVPVVQISAPDLPVPVTPDVESLSTPPAKDRALYNRLARIGIAAKGPPADEFAIYLRILAAIDNHLAEPYVVRDQHIHGREPQRLSER